MKNRNNIDAIKEAAKKWSEDNGVKNAGVLVSDDSHWRKLTNTWIAGALSDAAKQYWYNYYNEEIKALVKTFEPIQFKADNESE